MDIINTTPITNNPIITEESLIIIDEKNHVLDPLHVPPIIINEENHVLDPVLDLVHVPVHALAQMDVK